MGFPYTVGQRLVIELTNNQEVEGDCVKCAKDRIDIANIIEYPDRVELKGTLSYYRTEIASVHVLNEKDSHHSKEPELQLDETPETQTPRKVIALSQDEYDRLKSMTNKYIYLTKLDSEYYDAIHYLSNCENVAVFGVCSKAGLKSISMLMLSSWQQVYIFDLLLFNQKNFLEELKAILESNQIKKVMHNSQLLRDCLLQTYKVNLNNIFDTYVADMKLQEAETDCRQPKTRNISECLDYYLNFPNTVLEQVLGITLEEWEKRPLDKQDKIRAAQLVAYLITLKNKQQSMLLKSHHDMVEIYTQKLANAGAYEAQMILNSKNIVPEEIKKLL